MSCPFCNFKEPFHVSDGEGFMTVKYDSDEYPALICDVEIGSSHMSASATFMFGADFCPFCGRELKEVE